MSTNIADIKNPFIDLIEIEDFISPASKAFLRAATAGNLRELYDKIIADNHKKRTLFNIHAQRRTEELPFQFNDWVREDMLNLEAIDDRSYHNFLREAFNTMATIGVALNVNNVELDLFVTHPSESGWHIDRMKTADDFTGIEAIIGAPTIYFENNSPLSKRKKEEFEVRNEPVPVKRNHMSFARQMKPNILSMWRGDNQPNSLLHSTPPAWIDPNYRLLMSVRAYGMR